MNIKVAGKLVEARAGETVLDALWAAGLAETVQAGCGGGVCGACTVTVRFSDGRPGGTDLACMRGVEEGMEVFPCPVDSAPAQAPVSPPTLEALAEAFPTLNRCTECKSCTSACPMGIPVMDSVLGMQQGEFNTVSEDFITCIHCGLCRLVCEDKVQPHNMGLWVRRSLGQNASVPEPDAGGPADAEWTYLLMGDKEERLKRAAQFRKEGKVPR